MNNELKLYPLLSTRSKRALTKTRRRWGHPYFYVPRASLITRLSKQLSMTYDQVLNQLYKEREHLLSLLNDP